jgi:histidinol-phosphate aminotransferase
MRAETTQIAKDLIEIAGVATKRECHNRYRSVATEMMRPEIQRSVIERSARSSELSRKAIHESLLEALWRYSGVRADNIALAPDAETIVKVLSRSASQRSNSITYVGPQALDTYDAMEGIVNVIPSLVDYSGQDIAQVIPDSTEVLYLASPNPINGEVYTASQIKRILLNADAATVVVNESLYEYCGATCVRLLEEFENLIVLRSLSEAFGIEGQPLAYALGATEVIESLRKQIPPDSVSLITLISAGAALERQDVMRHGVNIVCENRIYLTALLRRLGAKVIATPANFALVPIAKPELALEVLGPQGVTLCEFERSGESRQFLRIPIGNERYCRGIIAALTRCPREYYTSMSATRNQNEKMLSNRQYNISTKETQR